MIVAVPLSLALWISLFAWGPLHAAVTLCVCIGAFGIGFEYGTLSDEVDNG